jgi:hypothetical protein
MTWTPYHRTRFPNPQSTNIPIYHSTTSQSPNTQYPIPNTAPPDPDIEPHENFPMPSGAPHSEIPLNTRYPERVLLVEFIPTYPYTKQGERGGRPWPSVTEPLPWRGCF